MKKLLFAIVALLITSSFIQTIEAQERTKIGDGIYIVNYWGNWVIEDDNKQMSIVMDIKEEKTNKGETFYNIICEGVTKKVTKTLLKTGISSVLTHVSSGLAAPFVPFINDIVNEIYEQACNHFK